MTLADFSAPASVGMVTVKVVEVVITKKIRGTNSRRWW